MHKSKSEHLPSVLFGRRSSPRKRGSKSEMTLRWVRDRHVRRRVPLLENKPIGDSELVVRQKLDSVARKHFGQGDAANVDGWSVDKECYEDYEGEDGEEYGGEDDDDDEDEFDENISSISGAELLQMLASKKRHHATNQQGNSFESQ